MHPTTTRAIDGKIRDMTSHVVHLAQRHGAARAQGKAQSIPDNQRIADARVEMKVAALGCAAARYDPAGTSLSAVAEKDLTSAALAYFRTLHRATTGRDPEMPVTLVRTERIEEAQRMLVVAGLGYVTSRNGADACLAFTRAAIGRMCQAAVRLGEAITGMEPGASHGDPSLHLDDGR